MCTRYDGKTEREEDTRKRRAEKRIDVISMNVTYTVYYINIQYVSIHMRYISLFGKSAYKSTRRENEHFIDNIPAVFVPNTVTAR
jgi:hypothetical protein